MTLWWLSFTAGNIFRGACIIEAETLKAAVSRAKLLGIYPGGKTLGSRIPASYHRYFVDHKDRFFDKIEARAIYRMHEACQSRTDVIWS